jgi:hypothetical protein
MPEAPPTGQQQCQNQADDGDRSEISAEIVFGEVAAKASREVELAEKAADKLEADVGAELIRSEKKLESTIDTAPQNAFSSSH